ncbi:prenylcysteine oxidase-like [Pseudophryne corroboree]|uniref:prenylcysteine oxidase-like n=1 Tax=Pseudophryne corroboree TaxID=495146 RepID=UPI0030816AF7
MAAVLLLVSLLSQLCAGQLGHPDPPGRIAVVGAGIGGSAVTYFLHQHFGSQVQIDVYEADRVGGRLATLTVNSQQYESGSPSLHSLNLHMQDFVKVLGLKHRRDVAGKSAIFSEEQLVLEETDWYLLNLFRLWWHYGISFLRLQMWVEEVMEKFMRVYKYQAHEYAFSSIEGLLRSLGGEHFVNMTQKSVSESLQGIGVSQRFIDDVISAVMKASYGQSVTIPALVGAMSLAGAQGNMWSVEGGNKLVCSGLLKLTKANVIHAKVTAVSLHNSEKKRLYEVQYEREGTLGSDYYDLVIVAAPLHKAGYQISFLNFQTNFPESIGSYHRVVSSIVHGYLNSSYFGFSDPKLFPFASILSTDTPDAIFHSLESLCPVNVSVGFRRKPPQEAAVWRVLSSRPLDRKELKTLFKSYYSVQAIEWQAFPSYGTTSSLRTLPPIVLHDGLYYLSGAEWAASSVEMSAVAAKNVALLAFNRWFELNEKIDQPDLMHKLKTEL